MTLEHLLGKPGFLYLASPYTKAHHGLSAAAYDAKRHAAHLMRLGFIVFSPIAHSHEIARVGGLDHTDHEMWMNQCQPLMEAASAMVCLKLPGWKESVGMAMEAEYFQRAGKPIVEMEPLQ